MKRINELVSEIVRISENSSPVIHDLSNELKSILDDETIYTHAEVVDILNRKEGIVIDED
jgi:DNA-binding PucR family transcriptional regulator